MARCLPPLPKLTEEDESDFESDFKGKVVPFQQPETEDLDDAAEAENVAEEPEDSDLPEPIDLLVPPGKASVVLTGPNTGQLLHRGDLKLSVYIPMSS